MTRDELREKVARAYAYAVEMQHSTLDVVKTLGFSTIEAFVDKAWPNYLPQADAAIAIIRGETLEEAARVAERVADGEAVKSRNALIGDEDDDIALRHADKEGGARDCAAAIRALKEKSDE